jgi:FtsZ-interacting cell division protein ZipA
MSGSIILFIIIGIISAIFSRDKKPEQKKAPNMPTFGNQTVPEKPIQQQSTTRQSPKSLEDFAKQVFEQLNETTEEVKKPARQIVSPVVQETVQKVERPVMKANRSERPPLAERAITKKVAAEKTSFVPKNRQDLINGFVMAEILGTPKAKRK